METLDYRYSRLRPFHDGSGAPFERPLTVLERDIYGTARRMLKAGHHGFALLRRGFSIEGSLDLVALTRALEALPARHDVLRTAYVEREGVVVAEVLSSITGFVRVIDVPQGSVRADETFAREEAVGFDLERAPLVRFVVLRLGPTRHRLYMLAHHIASDMISNDTLLHEITQLYASFTVGQREPMLPLLQYSDVARWQASWLDDAARAEYDAFWHQRLRRAAPLPINARGPSPGVSTPGRCATCHYTSAAALGALVAAFAKRFDTTVPMVMLTALAATMYVAGIGGSPLGYLSANRRYATIRTVGLFATMFPLRTLGDGACTFAELLAHMQRELSAALDYQDVSPPLTGTDGATPCRVVFNYFPSGSLCKLRLGEVDVQHIVGYQKRSALFDLWLNVSCDATGAMHLTPDYNADLFGAECFPRYLVAFEAVLTKALEDGSVRLDELASSAAAYGRES